MAEGQSKKMPIVEINGDLFTESNPYSSLADCVAKDLRMGKGIAVIFKKKFGTLGLKEQCARVGSVAVLERDSRFIYYLITKSWSNEKPTLSDLTLSLYCMRDHAIQNDVKMISMPRIGSGLDRLDWGDVKNAITQVFLKTDIQIQIYYL